MDTIRLFSKEEIPEGMVYIPSTSMGLLLPGMEHQNQQFVPAFFMDKYEITNKQYKIFVDSGGYEKEEFWDHEFILKGKKIGWKEAMATLVDRTNRPGPAGWEISDYPEGKAGHPVSGISWYEAAAYAKFVGKDLPTLFHFNVAATPMDNHSITPKSNFEGDGAAQVGVYEGIGGYGTYDLAGNVRDWHFNRSSLGNQRYNLGGGWNDQLYRAIDSYAEDPFERSDINGFRCIQYIDETNRADLEQTLQIPARDFRVMQPVGDEVFAIYKNQFNYDPTPLNPQSERLNVGSSEYTCEKITMDAAYGGEQMDIYVYLPTHAAPPYQTVVFFPHAAALRNPRFKYQYINLVDLFIKSGRAIVFPILKSTFERKDDFISGFPNKSIAYKEHVIMWGKDFRRTLDYLVTRDDLDNSRIGYFGWSLGAVLGAIIPAIEERVKVAILVGGGLTLQVPLPEVDQLHYLPRITQPFLSLNGRYDHYFPLESSQKPMLDVLGTPP